MHNILNVEPEAFEFDANKLDRSVPPTRSTAPNTRGRTPPRRPVGLIRFPDNRRENGAVERPGTNLEFEAPAPLAVTARRRMVDPAKVSCAKRDRRLPLFRAIGTNDPVGTLETVCQRAVAMLDNTIGELRRIRERVRAGEPLAFPLIADHLAWSLQTRMLMRATDARAWTASDRIPRTAGQIIRWLSNIRRMIASGHLSYVCLDTAPRSCDPGGTPALCCTTGTWACTCPNRLRIFLCRPFWNALTGIDAPTQLEFQAQTIIHEVSHIYDYAERDAGRGGGNAECISQFVADANGSPIDENFERTCGGSGPALPAR